MTIKRYFIASIALAAAFAFAAPVQADNEARIDVEQLRPWGDIESLAWPLQVAAEPECRDPSFRTGFEMLASPAQGMFVRSIAAGSPADGQLQLEDRVIALNGSAFPADGIKAYEQWVTGLREELAASDAVQVWTVERAGERLDVELAPVSVCHLDILYVQGDGPSLLRRENTLIFTPQLHDLAPEPWMVQAQVAHDLGHRLGQHEEKAKRTSRWANIAGNIMGALGGPDVGGAGGHALNIRRRPQEEVAADSAGIDLAVSIGLPEADLIAYWVDVLHQQASAGGVAKWLGAHPAHPSRIEALEERFQGLAQRQDDEQQAAQQDVALAPAEAQQDGASHE